MRTKSLVGVRNHRRGASNRLRLRQHVIVIRGRFAAWELLALDLDIMVRLDINTKE